MMPVTISQIARELGISRHAVSHVLNGREHKVSAETQKRIRDAVANMDYQRNRLVDVFRCCVCCSGCGCRFVSLVTYLR